MKTNQEKYDTLLNRINEVEDLMVKIMGQKAFLDCHLPLSNFPIGEEIRIRFDPSTLWSEFSFLEGAIIYHATNYATHVQKFLQNIKMTLVDFLDGNDIGQIGTDQSLSNKISYEFDSFIIKFQQASEEPTLRDISKATKGKDNDAWNTFEAFRVANSRNNVDGLYWQMNLLRNPAAHSIEPRYQERNGQAERFMGMSSNATVCHISENSFLLPCITLVDLKKSPKIKKIIQEELLNKGIRKPLWDVIMPNKSPSGRGKNTPYEILPSGLFEPYDLLGGFCELVLEAGQFLENINQIFYGNMGEYSSDHETHDLIYGQDDEGNPLITSSKLFDKKTSGIVRTER